MSASTPGSVRGLRPLRKSDDPSPDRPGGRDPTGGNDTVAPDPAHVPTLDVPVQNLSNRQGTIPRSSTAIVGSSDSARSMELSMLSLSAANGGAPTVPRPAIATSAEGAIWSGNAPGVTGDEAAPQDPGRAVSTSPVHLMSWKKVSHNGPKDLTTCTKKKTHRTGGVSHSHRGPTGHSRSTPVTLEPWLPRNLPQRPKTPRSSYGNTYSGLAQRPTTASGMRQAISACRLLEELDICPTFVPSNAWRLVRGKERLAGAGRSQRWGSLEVLEVMGHRAQSPHERLVAALAVPSTA